MLTSKERAQLRAQANSLDTTLMVGKGGVTQSVFDEADTQLEARELIKGRVLETAVCSAREISDTLCAALGAEGIQTVGSKFVIYRKSRKKETEKKARRKVNPVRRGAQERRRQAKAERERRNEYFHQTAIQEAIDRRSGKK